MAGGSLIIINCLYLLLVSPFLFRFVISESSYLNDAEIIKKKIPDFIEIVSKNNIEMSKGDIENVNKKGIRIEPFQNTPKEISRIRIPNRWPKMANNLEEFNLPKVEIEEDNIELKLEEIKEKIKEIKDFVFDYNNTENCQESTPVLGYPTKFDHKSVHSEENILQLLNTDSKTENLVMGLDLFDDEYNVESSLNNVTTSDQKKVLEIEQINQPNWKGSARHLIKSGPIKEELYNKLDEEGRSVAAEFESTYKKSEAPELYYPVENIDSVKDPEDFSIQEKQLNSKLILVNEIPSGEVMYAKNFSYEGEQHSNNKKKENALLSTPDQIEYNDFEDLKKDEIIEFSEEKNMNKLIKKKKDNKNAKRKTKHKKILEKQDFSSPKLSPIPLKTESPQILEPKNSLDRFQNSPTIPIGCKVKNKALQKKYSKDYLKYGYDDLQFEIEENTPLSPTLPSITSSMENNLLKEGTSYNSSLTLKLGKTPKKRDYEGYSELLDISGENSEGGNIPVTKDTQFLQIIRHKMPKRSNKKLGSFINPNLLSTKNMLRSETSSKTLVSNKDKGYYECFSEIFESSGTKSCEQTACIKIGDLICIPQNDNAKKIDVPKSNLPKRKNK
ncbi:putative integral membrane protein [Cryptosporidium meleagridis]|uniref:Putative integral membrane protein n=1 Tax=Cryptosporidium meleagridis TaxID=93969 RepID=A0A2P4Z403_9CRYT|nr:putative integral membrane protein [Cryptosporidium meleagridis]